MLADCVTKAESASESDASASLSGAEVSFRRLDDLVFDLRAAWGPVLQLGAAWGPDVEDAHTFLVETETALLPFSLTVEEFMDFSGAGLFICCLHNVV